MKKFLAILFGVLLIGSLLPATAAGQGPHSGNFKVWTKLLDNGNQIKFYAKFPQPDQKIQFLYQDATGEYVELDWLRVDHRHLNEDGSYKNLQNQVYFIRTLDLREGKNRVRISVDGKVVWGTKTYTIKEPASDVVEYPKVDSLVLADTELCKLVESQNQAGAGPKGFPHWTHIQSTGEVDIALIPIDFSNAPGDPSMIPAMSGEGAKVEAWAKHFARGKMSYKVQWAAEGWIRAPREAQWYGMIPQKGGQMLQSRQAALQDLITAADPYYDFAGVDLVYFVFPVEAESEYGASMYDQKRVFTSEEGTFYTSVYGEMGGSSNPDTPRSVWDHLVHEILHYQGLIGHGPMNGSQGFISTDQWGKAKAITMWESFLVGWVEDDDVACATKERITSEQEITLNAIDNPASGPEAAMIRLNADELIVIEYRDLGPYSSWKTGLTAYRVNVNAPHYRCDSCDQLESEAKNWWGYIRQAGSEFITDVSYEGIRIRSLGGGRVLISPDQQ